MNLAFGDIVKVTPSSKVVGDLALHLVAVGADPAEFAANPQRFDIPASVIPRYTQEFVHECFVGNIRQEQ